MQKILAAAVMVWAMTATANAVTVNASDVGFNGTTNIQGYVDAPNATSIPGLTGSLFLEFNGTSNGGRTWNFDYTVTNTSSGAITGSRISSFGFGTTPNVTSVQSTGLFDLALTPTNGFPNVNGAMAIIEMCFSAGNNACSGGDGVTKGNNASGTFALTFANASPFITLDAALFRFQSINSGAPFNFHDASGVGFNTTDVVINPNVAVPGPAVGAGIPGLIAACAALGMLIRRRRQRLAAA